MGRAGDFSLSGLARIESGQSTSLVATGQPLTDIQQALLSAYPDAPTSQSVYFGDRGSQSFKGYGALDVSVNYNIPVVKPLKPFFKFDVFNLLNNDKLIRVEHDRVSRIRTAPWTRSGCATGYLQGSRFGTGTSNANYPQSSIGTGLRGFRMSMGIQF